MVKCTFYGFCGFMDNIKTINNITLQFYNKLNICNHVSIYPLCLSQFTVYVTALNIEIEILYHFITKLNSLGFFNNLV